MKGLWRHVQLNYREGGVARIVSKSFGRIRQWLRSDYTCLVYDVSTATYKTQPRLALSRRELDFPQLVQLGYFKAVAFPEGIQERIASGSVCHGFFLAGELANIAWMSSDYIRIDGDWTVPAPAALAIYDCFTLPAFRSRGIYRDTLIMLIHMAREQGVARVLIAVDEDNPASIRGIERAGFQPWLRLTRKRRFGKFSFSEGGFALHTSGIDP